MKNEIAITHDDDDQATRVSDIISDTIDDVDYARENLKRLIAQNQEAIEEMYCLARDAEHPRAFEVLSTLIKQAADMNEQLVILQKRKKDIVVEKTKKTDDTGETTVTNNNTAVFVGSTTELQHALKGMKLLNSNIDEPENEVELLTESV